MLLAVDVESCNVIMLGAKIVGLSPNTSEKAAWLSIKVQYANITNFNVITVLKITLLLG